MKGQTLPLGSERLDLGVPAHKTQLWPDGADGTTTLGMETLLRKCRLRSQLVRECMAECLGVYVLIVSVWLVKPQVVSGAGKSRRGLCEFLAYIWLF